MFNLRLNPPHSFCEKKSSQKKRMMVTLFLFGGNVQSAVKPASFLLRKEKLAKGMHDGDFVFIWRFLILFYLRKQPRR
jgi:hypothetical protein